MRRMYLAAILRIAVLTTLALVATALLWLNSGSHSSTPASAATESIAVGDNWFCEPQFQGDVCETVINVGDTVAWDFSDASFVHTTTECGESCDNPASTPLWDSGLISDGSTVAVTFDEAATYLYYCAVHPRQMRGRIIVGGGAEEPTATRAPTATQTPSGPAGDVNCDSTVNAIDAALILQLTAGLIDSLPCPENADVNGDGSTGVIDAALVLQLVAGLIDSLPV